MEQRRIINQASAKQLAESINMKYFECSAVITKIILNDKILFDLILCLF